MQKFRIWPVHPYKSLNTSPSIHSIGTNKTPKESPQRGLRRRTSITSMRFKPMYRHSQCIPKIPPISGDPPLIPEYLCEYSPGSNEWDTKRKPSMRSMSTPQHDITAIQTHESPLQSTPQKFRPIACAEEFRNSHGDVAKVPRAGAGTSYLCCSNCDESNLNCDEIRAGALTIARMDVEAVQDSDWYCKLFIAPRWRNLISCLFSFVYLKQQ